MVNRSTHNTRIERLWLESGRHFARGWRAFFTRLGRLHFLDRDDPHHIWLLQKLFLEDIQSDCDDFCHEWNSHPLSGKGQNMAPLVRRQYPITTITWSSNRFFQDIRFLGQTQHGVYDEADNIDPSILHRYYGAAGRPADDRSGNETSSESESSSLGSTDSGDIPDPSSDPSSDSDSGSSSNLDSEGSYDSDADSDEGSGSSSGSDSRESSHSSGGTRAGVESEDENLQSWQGIAKTIATAQKRNVRHDAAEVARSAIPFEDAMDLDAYTLALGEALASDEYPAGFGLNEEYESVESYKTGRSLKPLVIPLPHQVWFPRIVVWCKALDLLKRLPVCKEAVAGLE